MAEPRTRLKRPQVQDPVKERDDWLQLLNELVAQVQGWIQPEWSTRVIEKEMFDPGWAFIMPPRCSCNARFPA